MKTMMKKQNDVDDVHNRSLGECIIILDDVCQVPVFIRLYKIQFLIFQWDNCLIFS